MRAAGLAAGLVAAAVLAGAVPVRLKSVRHLSSSSFTRVTVETTGDVEWVFDRLDHPPRLVFDLPQTLPGDGQKGLRTIPVGDARVKQIRVAETQPGRMRVVLDLDLGGEVDFVAEKGRRTPGLIIQLTAPQRRAAPGLPAPPPLPVSAEPLPERAPIPRVPMAKPEPPVVAAAATRREPTAAEKMAAEAAARAAHPSPASIPALPVPAATAAESPARGAAPKAAPVASAPLAMPPKASAARGSQTLIRALGLKLGRVVLDPGHGGHDHGTIGKGGLTEKELVLDVAKRLGALLEERLGVEVVYTRTEDEFIPLEERTQIANDQRADLFLSIHANSSPHRGVSGVETYYLNLTGSREAMEIAARENASSQRSIHELTTLIQKITTNEKVVESREFAEKVQRALYSVSTRYNSGASNRGVKKAPFVVLLGADMPSVLTEIGFVSNSREEALLKKPEHRQRMAEGLFVGVKRYAETLSHFQIATKD